MIPSGERDTDFRYATGMGLESGLYIRYGAKDDVLVTSPLEVDRARVQSHASQVVEDREAYVRNAWARLAVTMLREKGIARARVAPTLRAVYLEDLRAGGLDIEVDQGLFVAERRRKSVEEAAAIRQAQQAAEAAVVAVVRELAQANIKDGVLWSDGAPLTAEHLYARAQYELGEIGFTCPDMSVAGYEGPGGVAQMNHSTGHGVGLDVHEAPSLRHTVRDPLQEGDVVTVEPGLYLLGLGGVRIEDTGMVTKHGFENFTSLTRSLDPRDYL